MPCPFNFSVVAFDDFMKTVQYRRGESLIVSQNFAPSEPCLT
jgi:hypothetical protein